MRANDATPGPAAEPSRLYARVSSNLASRIAAGQYPVGARLPSERDLAREYAVSRPTVREAIIALELDGLVKVRVGSGVYVVDKAPLGGGTTGGGIDPLELLEARRSIEGEVCALADARPSPQKFSEEFQADYYRGALAMAARLPTVSGMSPWILKNFRSTRRLNSLQGSWNRRGLISETGLRKMAFEVLSRFYGEFTQEARP